MSWTPIESIGEIVSTVRQTYKSGKTRSIEFRKAQLRQLWKMISENSDAFSNAAQADLRKNINEFDITELSPVVTEIADALSYIDGWVKPEKPAVELVNLLSGAQIKPEPLGTVLIIGAWNYSFQLVFMPFVGALAAGNTVILKPSEVSSNMSKVIQELVPKYLDDSCYKVVTGGVSETTALLEQKFDHIFYTGNGRVARSILVAAAKYLTPVTLELGGKSPTIVASDADIPIAAKRIIWGKFLNSGQTCIAPDYILCTKEVQEKLLVEFKKVLKDFFGDDIKKSDSFNRIVNINHFKRISALIEKDKVAIGGETDESDLYISPTILVDVTGDSPCMQDEIFGPVLPIVNVRSLEEAIEFVNERAKPLSLYVFSKDFKKLNKVIDSTSSGAVVTNDCLMHFQESALPFGGVGESGTGAYHGKHTFDVFSHFKSIMLKDDSVFEFVLNSRYPPYTEQKTAFVKRVSAKKPKSGAFNFF